jgi:FkbM family methyltransferase
MMDWLFRKLPLFKGKERLARLLLKKAIRTKTDILIEGRFNCSYYLPNIVENVGFEIFINGEYEIEIQQLLFKLVPENGCFLDLGANIGSILIPLCKRRPDITAVAVEAAPWIFHYLEKNVLLNNLDNVQLFNNALFDEDNRELDFFSPRDKFGKGSLSPVFTKEAVKVKTKKIDTLIKDLTIKKVDVIKIDVEGFEYFVFKGAQELLEGTNAPVIIFEFVDWAEKHAMDLKPGAAQQLLKENGYQLYKINGNQFIPLENIAESGSSNMIASKKSLQPV